MGPINRFPGCLPIQAPEQTPPLGLPGSEGPQAAGAWGSGEAHSLRPGASFPVPLPSVGRGGPYLREPPRRLHYQIS